VVRVFRTTAFILVRLSSMKHLGIISLLFISALGYAQQNQLPEQIALDYFFENIFKNDFPEYKVIEFNDHAHSDCYYGIVNHCEDFGESLKEKIIHEDCGPSVIINADKSPVRVTRIKEHSSKLKVDVFSKIELQQNYYIHISVYRKLRFVEHYIFTINKENREVVNVCRAGEII